ncbi:MAG TPA: hypothetical protein DIC53_09390 [Synergistaceae bacterium]|jgi:acyl-ACP thioesterase|nr:hypothetical protein [Synergistaceae bacterium]
MLESTYSIPYGGIGPDGRMKLPVLLDVLQDMADRDAARMSMTVANLITKGVSWVLRQYRVTVDRYPTHDSTLTVRTWHGPRKNLYSLRAFVVRDERGPVASAETSWILIDLERGRPLRLDRHSTELYIAESCPMEMEFSSLPAMDRWREERPFSVRRWDLDRNNHVNNAVYFSWAAEAVPDDVASSLALRRVEAEYERPTEGHGEIVVRTVLLEQGEGRVYGHAIVGSDGERKARFVTEWRPRQRDEETTETDGAPSSHCCSTKTKKGGMQG